MPEWIANPGENCPALKLCAVGEANGMMQAESKAREELAKIFSTQVSSTTIVTTESTSQTKLDVVTGDVKQELDGRIKEVTNQVLEGVEIQKVWHGPESVFALAALDKKKVADKLALEMDTLDKEISSLYARGRRADIAKAIKMMKTRSALNQRYLFLLNVKYPGPIALTQLLSKRRELGIQDVRVELEFKSFDQRNEIKDILTTQLIGTDYKVVKTNGRFKIRANVSTEKEYLNVEGFEKHRFQLAITSFNLKNEKIGALDFSVSAIGRDFKQSYEEALGAIRNYIENHLDELNMD
ncbi:MAG: hypothetical protein Fur0010_04420 [Bdellovibrio sp.]